MRTQIQTIQCPKCGQQLPAWQQSCQFCGTALQNVQRPPGAVPQRAGFDNRLSWQESAYIIVSILMVIDGGYDFLRGSGIIPALAMHNAASSFVGIIGCIQAGLGIGLLAQQSWAQMIMKWYCVLSLVFNLLGIFAGLALIPLIGPLPMIIAIVMECLYGFMLYLISNVGDVDI